jgi:hypothetical protein
MKKIVTNIKYDWDSYKISATGGFPPIYKVNKAEINIIEKNKNREFKSNTEAISIKDIMTQRKEIEPFI